MSRRMSIRPGVWMFVWTAGFPVAWLVVSMAIFHILWATGLFPENESGPTFFGLQLEFWVCGPAPFVWLIVTILALRGSLPGTHPQDHTGQAHECPRRCECGYELRGIPGGSPCPECGRDDPLGALAVLRRE